MGKRQQRGRTAGGGGSHTGIGRRGWGAPRPDDADADTENRSAPESRVYSRDDYVALAVFPETATDLSQHPKARNRRAA